MLTCSPQSHIQIGFNLPFLYEANLNKNWESWWRLNTSPRTLASGMGGSARLAPGRPLPAHRPSRAPRKGARTGPARGRQYLAAARWTAKGARTERTSTATAPHGHPRRAGKCACATLGLQYPESPSFLLEFRNNYQSSRLSKNSIVLEILHLESMAVSLTSTGYPQVTSVELKKATQREERPPIT